MGSQPSSAEAPQQPFAWPLATRRAAWPYFSFTISAMTLICRFSLCVRFESRSFAADNFARFYGLVSGAAFGVEKPQQFLKGFGIGRVPKIGPLAPHAHEVLIFQFFEVMGQGAGWYPQFLADF